MANKIEVTIIDIAGKTRTIAMPAHYVEVLDTTELYDTAHAVAEHLENAPIDYRKDEKLVVEEYLRWCM